MKPSEFKKIIKEAVKEAIQEELKEILLEAVRSPKMVVTESLRDNYAQPYIEKPKTSNMSAEDLAKAAGGKLVNGKFVKD